MAYKGYSSATRRIQVRIGFNDGCYLGGACAVDVFLDGADPEIEVGSFDFTFAYHGAGLIFQQATAGELLAECGWGDFAYVYEPATQWATTYPISKVHVVGVAEIAGMSGGEHHMDPAGPFVLQPAGGHPSQAPDRLVGGPLPLAQAGQDQTTGLQARRAVDQEDRALLPLERPVLPRLGEEPVHRHVQPGQQALAEVVTGEDAHRAAAGTDLPGLPELRRARDRVRARPLCRGALRPVAP